MYFMILLVSSSGNQQPLQFPQSGPSAAFGPGRSEARPLHRVRRCRAGPTGLRVWPGGPLAGMYLVQHRRLWSDRRGDQQREDGQLVVPAGGDGGETVQTQLLRTLGGRAQQRLGLHHLAVLHHDQSDQHWLREHRTKHGRGEDLCCGHDDDRM